MKNSNQIFTRREAHSLRERSHLDIDKRDIIADMQMYASDFKKR